MTHLDEIKSRLSIEELVGSYVQLKKAGRNLRGLCPFHGEKTPSFMVSPEKEIAYCFGCQQGGDIFRFTMLVEKVEFPEAVEMLAKKTGVTIPRAAPQEHNKRLRILEMNQCAVEFFQESLKTHPDKQAYFVQRGLTPETIEQFQLGYAPDSFDALKNHLTGKRYKPEALVEAGLLSQRSLADKSTFDRFRSRLMFPIHDHQGNPIGFGGRVTDDGEPKYLNSPDTPVYNKSFVLYGLNHAKDAVKEKDMAIFVEGYMDVIASHQAGVKNVVATSGTALTPQQLKLIKRYTHRIAFAFDQDPAGMEAALRAIELAQMAEMDIKIIQVPQGKDPDECIKKDPTLWQRAAENPATIMDFYFNYALKLHDPETLEGKKGIAAILMPIIKIMSTEVEQGEHLSRLALTLKTDVKLLWNDLKNFRVAKHQLTPSAEAPIENIIFPREAYLLGLIFEYPTVYPKIAEKLIDSIPIHAAYEPFYKSIKKVYTAGSALSTEALMADLSPEEKEKVSVLGLLIQNNYPDFPEAAAQREADKLISSINRENLMKIQKEYEVKLRLTKDTQEQARLLNKYSDILKLTKKL